MTETKSLAKSTRYQVPTPLYVGLWTSNLFQGLFRGFGRAESSLMRGRLDKSPVDRPIYILGVPRCGTTVTLEMLSSHPAVATQRYADMMMPYVPFTWTWLVRQLAKVVPDKPQERIHQDRVQVTKLSPEGVEELFWLPFFPNLHSETVSCILTEKDTNPAFDRFYTETVQKLVLAHGRTRFLSKANENITRLLYLHRLFPTARFLLYVRHPAHHIASLMKQDRLFNKLAKDDPRIGPMTAFTGHFEFGPSKVWAKIGEENSEVLRLYKSGHEAEAWAIHWEAAYALALKQLKGNPSLAANTLLVRYEDLCHSPGETIDRIIAHAQLDPAAFAATRDGYLKQLSEPTYYKPGYTAEEIREMDRITGATRKALGYTASIEDVLAELRQAG